MKKELNDLLLKHFENPCQQNIEIPFVYVVSSSAFDKEDFMKLITLLGNSFLDYVESIKNYKEKGITVTLFMHKVEELKKIWESDITSITNLN